MKPTNSSNTVTTAQSAFGAGAWIPGAMNWRYASGYRHGWSDASNDFFKNNEYNSTCPSGHTHLFCNGYETGYTDEWQNFHPGYAAEQAQYQQNQTTVNRPTAQSTTRSNSGSSSSK